MKRQKRNQKLLSTSAVYVWSYIAGYARFYTHLVFWELVTDIH